MITGNLLSYAIQVFVVLLVGLTAPRLLRLRSPSVALRYWQGLLAALLLLPVLQPWRIVEVGSVTVETVGAGVAGAVIPPMPSAPVLSIVQWLLLVVAVVSAARLGWIGVGLLMLRGIRRDSVPATGLPARIEELQQRSGIDAEVRVSDRIPVPVTFGWRRPVVLVPGDFHELPESQQTGIVCHELIHIRRGDWPSVLIEQGLKALLWFHPAVHVLVGRIGLAREQLIDREVVRITGNRRTYLDALWHMARVQPAPASGPALFLLNRSDLFERVALLAEEANMTNKKSIVIAAAIVAVVVLAAASVVTLFPFAKTAAAGSAEMTAKLEDPGSEEKNGEEVRHPVKFVPEGELSEPKAIHKVNPKYPEEARKEKIQGEVVAESIIDHTGKVVDTKVLESPHELLSQATIDALQQWTFEPSRNKAGEAVDVLYVVTMKYRLDAGKKPAEAAAEENAAKKQ